MKKGESSKIQVLRGLAIIAVVFIHNTPIGMAQVWCRPFINFSVGLFLFLSGLLSSVDKWDPKKRIMKVVVPYFIWTFVYVLIGNVGTFTQIPLALWRNLITAGSAAVMYYVFVYCEFTLLIPLIDRLARSKYRWLGFLITPAEIIVMRLIPLVVGFEINTDVRVIMRLSCLGWFTYYYLGYMLGNGLLKIKVSTAKILLMWIGAIAFQILEGYWYFSMGERNCGTQLKLTAILSGVLFSLLAYRYLTNENTSRPKGLHVVGDLSFGIFFAHLAIMFELENHIQYYRAYMFYPLNAIVAIVVTILCVASGRKVLGKYAKYLAF